MKKRYIAGNSKYNPPVNGVEIFIKDWCSKPVLLKNNFFFLISLFEKKIKAKYINDTIFILIMIFLKN